MITRIRHTGALWLCTLVLVLTACGSESPTDGEGAGTGLPPNTIGPNGGTLDFAGGNVTLVFPAAAVSQNLTITVQATGTFPSAPTVVSGTAYDFGPAGTGFAQPVQLTVKYDPPSLPSAVQESELKLYKVVATGWQQVAGSSVNVAAKTVTGQITTFSVFGILGVPVASVTVTPASAAILVSETLQLTATTLDAAGNVLTGRAVTWSSSDEAVATVDATGLVTGVAVGSVAITATSEGLSGTAAITVDTTFTVHGIIRFIDIEGGCWVIVAADNAQYHPINLPAEFKVDGLPVRVVLRLRDDLVGFCPGRIVEIVSIEVGI